MISILYTAALLGYAYCFMLLMKYAYFVYVLKIPKDTVLKAIEDSDIFFKAG